MPISETEWGITTYDRLIQFSNAATPMHVTEVGIIMLVKPLQLKNAPSPIEITEFGMVVFWQPKINVLVAVSMMALQLFRESYTVFPLATATLARPLQPENA